MKKILALIILSLFSFSSIGIEKNIVQANNIETQNYVTLDKVFIILGELLVGEIPGYKDIQLNFKNVGGNEQLYKALQKLVTAEVINNVNISIDFNAKITLKQFKDFVEKSSKVNISRDINDSNNFTTKQDVLSIFKFVDEYKKQIDKKQKEEIKLQEDLELQKFEILKDVYSTLLGSHFDKSKINKIELLNQAILGLTKGSNDQYTTYFPPTENTDFFNNLQGSFEGIGAYVEMEKPGILKIISPISGSPAEKAGLLGGDVIFKVGDVQITNKMTLNQAVSYIKGPAGTKVKLSILRGTQTLDFEVTRGVVSVKDVEYKILNNQFFYIKIRMFGDKVFQEFKASLEELKKQTGVKKIIIDLRNNPGGFLDAVNKMLSLFVEKDKPVAVVKYIDSEFSYLSVGFDKIINLGDYKVYILANSGSASASEIMIGTLKDYFPDLKIIGEKTYGKGSVQTIKEYADGSSLKYTIAKWFTGLTHTGIDGIGINPDIEVKLDNEAFKNGKDTQLDYILNNY